MVHGNRRRDLFFDQHLPNPYAGTPAQARDIPLLAAALLARVDRVEGREIPPLRLSGWSGRRYSGNIRS